MPKLKNFYWSATRADGKMIIGEIQAVSKNLARLYLNQRQLEILSLRKKNLWHPIWQKKINLLNIAVFIRQLATLIKAGIPLIQSFNLLQYHSASLDFSNILVSIQNHLEQGKDLTSAIKQFPSYFNKLTCSLIKIGEQTGTLITALEYTAVYLEKNLLLNKMIKKALIYPIILCISTFIISSIMILFVVPCFVELFANSRVTLPWFTILIISISYYFKTILFIIFMLVISLLLGYKYVRKLTAYQQWIVNFLIRIPFLGYYIKRHAIINFARSMGTMLGAGISILTAINICKDIISPYFYLAVIDSASMKISAGQPLHRALYHAQLFTPLTIQMIKVGEESGMLAPMLEKIVTLYESELEYFLSNLGQMIEPLIIAILGVVIGSLVIAMYLPLFKLGMIL